jgi:deoxyribodipyrimidine photo-lyase
MYNTSLFIFRRDLRLEDNIGLIEALKNSEQVVPIFIFTPEQLSNSNAYKSSNCVQFMMDSLESLEDDLKKKGTRLRYFYGKPGAVVKDIVASDDKIDAVFVNRDYTPYSKRRDKDIQLVCEKYDVAFKQYDDIVMYPISSLTTTTGEVFTKFTPFYNYARTKKVNLPLKNRYTNYSKKALGGEFRGNKDKFYEYNKNIAVVGGRDHALKILNGLDKFKSYNKDKNMLAINTTRLSAYLKFGCVSIREVYHKIKATLGARNDLIRQLYWREFYYNIGNTHGYVFDGKNFNEKYNKVKWHKYSNASKAQKDWFDMWCDGTTGFPIVDACMKELNTTGFMHNRGRLIVASFLTKNLFWHWTDGERYFAQNLVDYDPIINSGAGNWGWVAGSGVDAQPFFRVFNPWLQSKKFDPDCEYIKKWLPELRSVENKHIHEWYDYHQNYKNVYYAPMVDFSKTAERSKTSVGKIFKH